MRRVVRFRATACALVCLAACASATIAAQMPKYGVTVTADKKADFTQYKTYRWETGWQSHDKTVHQPIVAAVDREGAKPAALEQPAAVAQGEWPLVVERAPRPRPGRPGVVHGLAGRGEGVLDGAVPPLAGGVEGRLAPLLDGAQEPRVEGLERLLLRRADGDRRAARARPDLLGGEGGAGRGVLPGAGAGPPAGETEIGRAWGRGRG